MIYIVLLPIDKNIKMSSFKSSENVQKKEGGPDRCKYFYAMLIYQPYRCIEMGKLV